MSAFSFIHLYLSNPICHHSLKQMPNKCCVNSVVAAVRLLYTPVFQFESSLSWNQWVGPGFQDPRCVGDTRSKRPPEVQAVGVPPQICCLLLQKLNCEDLIFTVQKTRLLIFLSRLAGLEQCISTSPLKKAPVSHGWSLAAPLQLFRCSIRCSPMTLMNASLQRQPCGTHTLGKSGTTCK